MPKIRVLFLAANPIGTERLSLDREIREISEKIRISEFRDAIELISIWAVRPDDLLQSLNTYQPQVVHFSGHGSPDGEIVLLDKHDAPKAVSPDALRRLFTTLKDNIQVVILNACYSEAQASAIAEVIDCTVGMKEAIGDEAAIAFASSFYRAVANARSIQDAYEQGLVSLMLEGIPQENVPVLITRPSVDPSRLILIHSESVTPILSEEQLDSVRHNYQKPKEILFDVQVADVCEFIADVLALKYAMYLYGADLAVATAVGKTDDQIASLVPTLGSTKLLYTQGTIAAERILFVNVGDLYHFNYEQIQQFAFNTLASLAHMRLSVRHIATTIHGVGYGLDEAEALRFQLAGYSDAITQNTFPAHLQRITIVEKQPQRAALLQKVLADYLPRKVMRSGNVANDGPSYPSTQGLSGKTQVGKREHVFVAMPFSDEMTDIFYYGIQGPVSRAGLLCERIDADSFTGDILQRIKSRIEGATYLLAEVTHPNPNVFLEVGYAWGCGKQTILLTQDVNKLPFDVRGQRCLIYGTIRELETALEKELQALARVNQC